MCFFKNIAQNRNLQKGKKNNKKKEYMWLRLVLWPAAMVRMRNFDRVVKAYNDSMRETKTHLGVRGVPKMPNSTVDFFLYYFFFELKKKKTTEKKQKTKTN